MAYAYCELCPVRVDNEPKTISTWEFAQIFERNDSGQVILGADCLCYCIPTLCRERALSIPGNCPIEADRLQSSRLPGCHTN